MITIPNSCPRGRMDCVALARIEADDGSSFYCCGDNNGKMSGEGLEQDRYTVCFKGEFNDTMHCNDKRDLTHQAAVLMQTLAVIEKAHGDDEDWSPWKE